MKIRPINNDEDYQSALAEISRLMDAPEDTASLARLDVLATQVESYEAEHCPVAPPSPLAAMEYEWEKRGLAGSTEAAQPASRIA